MPKFRHPIVLGYLMLIIGVARSEWVGFNNGHIWFANRFVGYSRGSRNCIVICALDVMVNTVNVLRLVALGSPKTRHKMPGFRWMNPARSPSGAIASGRNSGIIDPVDVSQENKKRTVCEPAMTSPAHATFFS